MRSAYRTLAYLIAALVVVQSMSVVFGIAGESRWISEGGVMDKAVVEAQEFVFPEVLGFLIHSINGTILIPLAALIMLILSFFTKLPGAVKWAGLILLLVAVQANLGFFSHSMPILGALHGLVALLLLGAAVYAGLRVRDTAAAGEPRHVTTS
ncbi:hypothetical protein OHA25_40760 [Nonomuraea sp. NBC_00507]|uniref:hypothetical protein n=1 Tax=Nonomuraea sp. NBC_00507 TaxID=2976002 RepID=UPI002E18D4CA